MTLTEDPITHDSPNSDERSSGPRPKRDVLSTDTIAMASIFVAAFAFIAAVFAIALAARSIDEHRAVLRASGGSTAPEVVNVSLKEFAITPGAIDVTAGATTLKVTNDGTVMHNLSIDGITGPMLNGGEDAELDVSTLAPGTYVMRCDVAGHEAAGMKVAFTVS